VLLRPSETLGGATIRFEGEAPGAWEADLLIVAGTGALRRVPLAIDSEGRGRADVPLADVSEMILLVRNLETEPDEPRHYAWSAQAVHGYPFELSALDATRADKSGTVVAWETAAEHGVIGFNVVRSDDEGGGSVRVNPVWIPAMGDEQTPASYQFVDATALPGASYAYRIEGVTENGLSSLSDAVTPRDRPTAR